jgi:Raf kinase inhibitor-like YbhB/YbcL family protein
MKLALSIAMAGLALMIVAFMVSAQQPPVDSSLKKSEVKMQIFSPDFKEGEMIPVKFTCDGSDISPALNFLNVPAETKSYALICDDPDAPSGDFVHWVIYNIPPQARMLPEKMNKGVSSIVEIKGEEYALQNGKNDFGRYGYGGPCPPKGKPHRYYFKVYALDIKFDFTVEEIKSGITKKILLERVKGHVLEDASLMGKYQRQ